METVKHHVLAFIGERESRFTTAELMADVRKRCAAQPGSVAWDRLERHVSVILTELLRDTEPKIRRVERGVYERVSLIDASVS